MKAMRTKTRCPTCGHAGMVQVERDIATRAGRKTVTVRGVSVEECPRCGERLYNLAALRRLRAVRTGRGRTRAA